MKMKVQFTIHGNRVNLFLRHIELDTSQETRVLLNPLWKCRLMQTGFRHKLGEGLHNVNMWIQFDSNCSRRFILVWCGFLLPDLHSSEKSTRDDVHKYNEKRALFYYNEKRDFKCDGKVHDNPLKSMRHKEALLLYTDNRRFNLIWK